MRQAKMCRYMNNWGILRPKLHLLIDWFAQKNVDDTIIFITGTNQVCLITDNIVPLQSGSVFYERAKLTGAQYKHRYWSGTFENLSPKSKFF